MQLVKLAISVGILSAVSLIAPARANFVVEPSFEQIMDQSQLVVIGTVTAIDGRRNAVGSTARVSIRRTLKGESGNTIVVSTYSRIAELDPQCCDVGATYMMFLRRLPNGQFGSVLGVYGMRRIAGPLTRIEVVPASEAEPRRRD